MALPLSSRPQIEHVTDESDVDMGMLLDDIGEVIRDPWIEAS
jgi:hypothetical protein